MRCVVIVKASKAHEAKRGANGFSNAERIFGAAISNNMEQMMTRVFSVFLAALFPVAAFAQQANYTLDPAHTFPSFEADHMGISVWRGKMNKSSGKVALDKTAGQGTVEVVIDLASIDFGHDQLNKWATGKDFFDVKKYPKAVYKGKLVDFAANGPTRAVGELTMHGVTKPVELKINSFKCVPHPMFKRELCGADATATFNRDDFGLSAGKEYGFRMDVVLRIQAEAVADK